MNLSVLPAAYLCRKHAAAILAWLYRIRIVLVFVFVGSLLYACGVWDMLNEVSIRENNGITWPVSSMSMLAKYHAVNKSSSSVHFGNGNMKNTSHSSSVMSSAVALYRGDSGGGAVFPGAVANFANDMYKSPANNKSAFYYSTTFYYIETSKKTSNIKKQRVRTKQQSRQRKRMAILPQSDKQVLMPLPFDHFTPKSDKNLGDQIALRPDFHLSLRHEPNLAGGDRVAEAASATDDSGDGSNDIVDERQRAFMVVYQVSSSDNNKTAKDGQQHANSDKFFQMLKAAGVDNEDSELDSRYSPTATPNPLPPLTMSLQPTPQPEISSSYFTSTIAGATNPTIREPHNYDGLLTTRRTYYRPIVNNNNNTRSNDSDAANVDESDDADSGADDNSWWLRPMKLSTVLNVSSFPFMQYMISPQCTLPLYNRAATEQNVTVLYADDAARISSKPSLPIDEYSVADVVNKSAVVRHPNCAEAFKDGKYLGSNRNSTGGRRVLILTKSAQAHVERRSMIRQTWGSHPQLEVRFLIGRAAPALSLLPPVVDEAEFLNENGTESDGDSFTSWIQQAYEAFLGNNTNSSNAAVNVSFPGSARLGRRTQRSAPESISQQSIRNNTTKNDADKPIFDCKTLTECSLIRESQQFNDIILTDFIDNYYNNTFKTLSGIHWAAQFCRLGSVEYVLLSDDDMWLNPFNFLEYLENATRNGSISADRDLYMGDLFPNSKPMRIRWSKWYVPVSVYKFDRYPPYITASAILMSRSTLIKFAEESLHTELFMYDDIFLAILARQLGINATRNHLFSSFNRVDVLDESTRELFSNLIVSHGYGQPLALQHAWNTTVCQQLFRLSSSSNMPNSTAARRSTTTLLPAVDSFYHLNQISLPLSSSPKKTSLWRRIFSVFGDADRPPLAANRHENTMLISTKVFSSSDDEKQVMIARNRIPFDVTHRKSSGS